MNYETKTISTESSSTAPTLYDESQDEQTVVIASSPFDNPKADLILRSSDKVDFQVFKIILSLASPIFTDMFSLPQPAISGHKSGVSVLQVSEDSKTMDLLLRFCYPVGSPRLAEEDVLVIGNVLSAALKYDIHVAVESAGEAFSARTRVSRKDALAAYAVACHHRLEKQARIAARSCLRWPVPGLVVPELALASALDYCNLLDFHERAIEVAVALFNRYDFLVNTCSAINPPPHANSDFCESFRGTAVDATGERSLTFYAWWSVARDSIVKSLRQAPLEAGKLSYAELATIVIEKCDTCHICKNQVLLGWEKARGSIVAAVNDAVNGVELTISWRR